MIRGLVTRLCGCSEGRIVISLREWVGGLVTMFVRVKLVGVCYDCVSG